MTISGIPLEFLLFGLTLLGVAIFHGQTMGIAVAGAAAIALYKITFAAFATGPGLAGFGLHLAHEWVVLANLLFLLMGFALLSRHFEKSHVPVVLPEFLPAGWKGGFILLGMVWVLSSFLDNIAGALIGGAMAHQLFRGKVHIGFIAAIVAAANAGGAWSVLGDTTTTMMWIAGVSPGRVFEAVIGATIALFLFGIPAAIRQHKFSPMCHAHEHTRIDWTRVGIVALILLFALATNLVVNLKFAAQAEAFPFIGVAVWIAILISVRLRRPDWEVLPRAGKGSVFLLALVLCASMMPVEKLPPPTWQTTFGFGFLSAVFDNIPLTALALKQGGYDWGFLAYAVGFGGSMIWFGSSAGVALSNVYPEARSIGRWLRHGWWVPVSYIAGFFAMFAVWGWHPDAPATRANAPAPSQAQSISGPVQSGLTKG